MSTSMCTFVFKQSIAAKALLWACVSFKDCKDMCPPNSPRSWKTLKLYWYSVCSTVHSSGNPCGKTSIDIFWHEPAIVWTYRNTSKERSIVNWERDEDMRPIVRSQDSCWIYTVAIVFQLYSPGKFCSPCGAEGLWQRHWAELLSFEGALDRHWLQVAAGEPNTSRLPSTLAIWGHMGYVYNSAVNSCTWQAITSLISLIWQYLLVNFRLASSTWHRLPTTTGASTRREVEKVVSRCLGFKSIQLRNTTWFPRYTKYLDGWFMFCTLCRNVNWTSTI